MNTGPSAGLHRTCDVLIRDTLSVGVTGCHLRRSRLEVGQLTRELGGAADFDTTFL